MIDCIIMVLYKNSKFNTYTLEHMAESVYTVITLSTHLSDAKI
jgi:hypothetical protein